MCACGCVSVCACGWVSGCVHVGGWVGVHVGGGWVYMWVVGVHVGGGCTCGWMAMSGTAWGRFLGIIPGDLLAYRVQAFKHDSRTTCI